MADKQTRARSFGEQADLYDRTRPAYPAEVLELAGAAAWHRVADVGAGTGKFTGQLVERGLDLTAVEPDPGMRAVLEAKFPALQVVSGTGESLPFEDGSMDALTYAQAWHWVEEQKGFVEAARVLRPGGSLLLVWNLNFDAPWLNELHAITKSTAFVHQMTENLPAEHPGFGEPELIEVPWSEPLTRDHIVERARTWSAVHTLPEAEREEVIARLERLLAEHPDVAGVPDPLQWSHVTLGVRYPRL